MKTNVKLTVVAAALLVLAASCANDAKNVENSVEPPLSAKEYVAQNTYIELPTMDGPLASPDRQSEEMKKAVLYRFYKHVKIIDNQYVWDISSGKEINISENIFNELVSNLTECNEWIKEKQASGKKVEFGDIGEEYLKSLIAD